MCLRVTRSLSLFLFVFALCDFSIKLFGADLMPLDKGRNVHLIMLGQGPLCDAKVEQRSQNTVTVRLLKTTSECGHQGELIHLSQDEVADLTAEQRLTKKRILAKVLLGSAAVAALTAVPLTSSDPESWLIVSNGVLPGFVVYGAWNAVLGRRDYLIFLNCSDRQHCFSDRNRSSQ